MDKMQTNNFARPCSPVPGPLLVARKILFPPFRLDAWFAWREFVHGVRLHPLTVTGNSMTRAGIQDGDTIWMRRTRRARDGDIVCVRCWHVASGCSAVVKRLVVTASGQHWYTSESDNPRAATFRLPDSPKAAIYGVIVGVSRGGRFRRLRRQGSPRTPRRKAERKGVADA